MDHSTRILLALGLFAGGFFLPVLWIGTVVIAIDLYTDTRPEKHDRSAGRFPLIRDDDDDWVQKIRDVSESPAEMAFLDAMIEAFSLQPVERSLQGSGMKLRMQVQALRYRLDFLVDETLVVEIDGAEWHGSPEAKARDARRDAELSAEGYTILRIPARIALYDPERAIELVAAKRPLASASHQRNVEERAAALREGARPANLLRTARRHMEDLSDATERWSSLAEQYRDQTKAGNRSRYERAYRAILDEYPADPSPDIRELGLGAGDVDMLVWADDLSKPDEDLSPDAVARLDRMVGRLAILRERKDLERKLEEIERKLDADPRLREIFDSIDLPDGGSDLFSSPPPRAARTARRTSEN